MANEFKTRAVESKPRERIESAGTATVASGAELLAVILKTGTAGCDVMELARRLIDAFGSVEALVRTDLNGLRTGIDQYNRSHPERRVTGLGRVKTLELAAAFELARRGYASRPDLPSTLSTAADVAAYMRTWSDARAEQEVFWVIALDSKHRPLAEPQRVAVGTVNGVSVHPRDVFKVAVRWNAQSVIVVHNHPSGDPSPSREDIQLTRRLQEAAQMMGIPLLDHVILGDASQGRPGYVSLGGSVV